MQKRPVKAFITQFCPALCNPAKAVDCSPPGSPVHGDSPGRNPGVGCHFLLQGIFPTQGSNLGLLHCRRILYHLSHQGSPPKKLKEYRSEVIFHFALLMVAKVFFNPESWASAKEACVQVGTKPERSLSTHSCSCLGTWEDCQVLGMPRLGQLSRHRSGVSLEIGTDLQRVLKQCCFSPLLTTLLTLDARRFHMDGLSLSPRTPTGS